MRRDRIDEPQDDDEDTMHPLVTALFLIISLGVVGWLVHGLVKDHRECTDRGGVQIVVRGWSGEERCVRAASLEEVR